MWADEDAKAGEVGMLERDFIELVDLELDVGNLDVQVVFLVEGWEKAVVVDELEARPA